MIIIKDNNALLRFIPNVISTVPGERSLFSKLEQQLEQSEQWLMRHVTGEDMLRSIDTEYPADCIRAAEFIASDALCNALPSLDLVLTPNGFGIVSNSNVAPASKERVERLADQLGKNRDKALDELVTLLRDHAAWHNSERGRWLASSFLVAPVLDVIRAGDAAQVAPLWDAWIDLRHKAASKEQSIAERWLGEALTARLKTALAAGFEGSDDVARLAMSVRNAILDQLNGNVNLARHTLASCVQFIKDRPTMFPEWFDDKVAELFQEDRWRFKNDKKAPGYFF